MLLAVYGSVGFRALTHTRGWDGRGEYSWTVDRAGLPRIKLRSF